MRRKDKEITDIDAIEKIIDRSLFCRIGLSDRNRPYIVPMCFGYRRGILYIHSAPEGLKIDLLRINQTVCFQMDCDAGLVRSGMPCDWGVRYRSVNGTGLAVILEDAAEKADGLTCIMQKYSHETPGFHFTKKALNATCVIKILIETISGKQSGN